jgi:hypothetical protein
MNKVKANSYLKEVGYELMAVVNHLEQTMIRAGYKIEGEKAVRIKVWRALAGQLIAGDKAETQEISQALANLNQEIEKLGQDVRQRGAQAALFHRG